MIADLGRVRSECRSAEVREALERCRAEHGPAVERLIRETARDAAPRGSPLVEMCEYHMATGGKRLRALIPLLAAEAMGLDPVRVRPFAAACEMLHNATLVHDDLQDGDTHRRGRETVWKRWSPAQAINVGDAMFYWTLALVGRVDAGPGVREALRDLVVRRTIDVIDGQARELRLKDEPNPTLESYFAVVEGKTSGLFELPLAGTAVLAEAPAAVRAALVAAGRHLGVLFQIQDDVLDLYGDKGRGARGGDIAEGKISVLVAHCLERGRAGTAARLRSILAQPREATTADDVREAEALFARTDSLRFALGEIRRRAALVRDDEALAARPPLHALLAGLAGVFLEPIRPVVAAWEGTGAGAARRSPGLRREAALPRGQESTRA
jgi:geranylgeranyl pyrophosphate synthase